MKKMKNLFAVLMALVICVMLVGCGSSSGKMKVGILFTASHDALSKAKEGFVEALAEKGYTEDKVEFVVRNPEGDLTVMGNEATTLVRSCDLVLGIGTPAAKALQNARDAEKIDLPILFTAVTDPVGEQLIADVNKPVDITGTNDMNPVVEQVNLIKELLPNVKKIGVIYNISESNSKVQSDMVEAEAAKSDIEVVVKTVAAATEISAMVTTLTVTEKVELIYIPTDNLLAANMPAVDMVAAEQKVPVICGEAGMVEAGGTLTYSIDYKALGVLTGEMAAKILDGTPVSEVPSTSVDASGCVVVVNEANLTKIGLELPQSIKDKLNK